MRASLSGVLVKPRSYTAPVLAPVYAWVSAFGPTHWEATDFTWTGTTFVCTSPIATIKAKATALLASARKVRITYTNTGPAYPIITRTDLYFQEYFTERAEDGTWTDELWAPLPVGGIPFDSRLQFDPGDNGLQSVTLSNIEVYIQM